MEESEWNVIAVRPRSEKSVAWALSLRGVEQYLPVYRGRYRSAGRFKDVDLPLFPQYVFCKMQTGSRAQVLSTPGVFRFLAFGSRLATVDSFEMENIRRAVTPEAELQPWPFLAAGDWVEIAEGPLSGLVGRLISTKGESRLILGISLLQRSVAVTLDRRWVRPSALLPAA
jgi:transcription antitermination factor NusG